MPFVSCKAALQTHWCVSSLPTAPEQESAHREQCYRGWLRDVLLKLDVGEGEVVDVVRRLLEFDRNRPVHQRAATKVGHRVRQGRMTKDRIGIGRRPELGRGVVG